jgi:flagellar protein FlgJ
MTSAASPAYVDLNRFSGLRAQAAQDPHAALGAVAKEFEAMFVQMMLKAARDAAPTDSGFDSEQVKLYQELFDNQVALSIAGEGKLGFADLLARQLPQQRAANEGPVELRLPERRLYPNQGSTPFVAPPEPPDTEEVVDISTWQARITDRAFGDDARGFAARMLRHAKRAAGRLGTTPEVLVAQAALETGWGQHVMPASNGSSSNNLFGIKADRSWDGAVVRQGTLEYIGGRPVRVNAAFRSYPDAGAAFDDYAEFIARNPRYQQALERAADPKAYVQALQRAGYATDPQYAHKIMQIHDQLAALASDPNQG